MGANNHLSSGPVDGSSERKRMLGASAHGDACGRLLANTCLHVYRAGLATPPEAVQTRSGEETKGEKRNLRRLHPSCRLSLGLA